MKKYSNNVLYDDCCNYYLDEEFQLQRINISHGEIDEIIDNEEVLSNEIGLKNFLLDKSIISVNYLYNDELIGIIGAENLCIKFHDFFKENNINCSYLHSSYDISEKNNMLLIYVNYYENQNELEEINRKCLDNQIKWFKVIINGNNMVLGPLYIPDLSGCFHCKMIRKETNALYLDSISEEQEILKKLNSQGKMCLLFNNSLNIAQSMTLNVILGAINKEYKLVNKELYFNISTFDVKYKYILKVPGCWCCNGL